MKLVILLLGVVYTTTLLSHVQSIPTTYSSGASTLLASSSIPSAQPNHLGPLAYLIRRADNNDSSQSTWFSDLWNKVKNVASKVGEAVNKWLSLYKPPSGLLPESSRYLVSTPYGDIQGVKTNITSSSSGAIRFTLQYAHTNGRWATSSTLKMTSITDLPPACPQSAGFVLPNGVKQDEECLWMTVYAPEWTIKEKKNEKLPVFFCNDAGAASSPGLDGSILSTFDQKAIVVVVQYRLGILGLLPPASVASQDPNLALKDIILALQFTRNIASSLGGDGNSIVLGGQSSGASMIRALLASPSASGLFNGAILQSDPMIYGNAPQQLTEQLQKLVYQNTSLAFSCPGGELACLRGLPASAFVAVQELLPGFIGSIPGVPLVEPLRPTHGYPSLPVDFSTDLTGTGGKNLASVPLLITTVISEAGQLVQNLFPTPPPPAYYAYSAVSLVGPERGAAVLRLPIYDLSNATNVAGAKIGTIDETRSMMTKLFTDAAWKCPTRQVASLWSKKNKKVWLAEFKKGETYIDNLSVGGICLQTVCHEDDLYPTFGRSNGDTDLQKTIHTCWSNFIHHLDPNGKSGGGWKTYSGDGWVANNIKALGGSQEITACPKELGTSIKYDWQMYS